MPAPDCPIVEPPPLFVLLLSPDTVIADPAPVTVTVPEPPFLPIAKPPYSLPSVSTMIWPPFSTVTVPVVVGPSVAALDVEFTQPTPKRAPLFVPEPDRLIFEFWPSTVSVPCPAVLANRR